MANLEISDALARQLKQLSEREKRSIDELLTSLLSQYTPNQPDSTETPRNLLLMLAEAAEKYGLSSGRSDIASRSREILSSEWPEYLKQRRDSNGE